MLPGGFEVGQRIFAVDPEEHVIAFLGIGQGDLEVIERRTPATARYQFRHATHVTAPLQQLAEALLAAALEISRVASTLQVDGAAHQRFPPNRPRVHNCPSRYFSSQGCTSSWARRRSAVR